MRCRRPCGGARRSGRTDPTSGGRGSIFGVSHAPQVSFYNAISPQGRQHLGRGVARGIDQLRGPADSAGTLNLLLPVVEAEDAVSGVAGRALNVTIGTRVGLLHAGKVASKAIPRSY